MLGCGWSDASIAVASCDFATDDGRVSGSKRVFSTRASFAESVVGEVETAIMSGSADSWNVQQGR